MAGRLIILTIYSILTGQSILFIKSNDYLSSLLSRDFIKNYIDRFTVFSNLPGEVDDSGLQNTIHRNVDAWECPERP